MGQRLLVEPASKVIRRLKKLKHKFKLDRTKGGHKQFVCKKGCHTVTVPIHKSRDLTKSETMSIIRQAGVTKKEFYS